jgi:hypothetical protein
VAPERMTGMPLQSLTHRTGVAATLSGLGGLPWSFHDCAVQAAASSCLGPVDGVGRMAFPTAAAPAANVTGRAGTTTLGRSRMLLRRHMPVRAVCPTTGQARSEQTPLLGFIQHRPSTDTNRAHPLPERVSPLLRPRPATVEARSVLVVPPDYDGFLCARPCGFVAPRSRPWGLPCFRGACRSRVPFPDGIRPFEAFPSPAASVATLFPLAVGTTRRWARPQGLTIRL